MPTLSGVDIPATAAMVRIIVAAIYVAIGVAGLSAIGVFFSTLTESGVGAAVATVSLAIISQILDGLTTLHAIHPYLFTHDWLAFVDLFRSPVAWDAMRGSKRMAHRIVSRPSAGRSYLQDPCCPSKAIGLIDRPARPIANSGCPRTFG